MLISIPILKPDADLIEITFAKAALFLENRGFKEISIEIEQSSCTQRARMTIHHGSLARSLASLGRSLDRCRSGRVGNVNININTETLC